MINNCEIRDNNDIIYSLINVELRVDSLPCLINIPLPITYTELTDIYDGLDLHNKRLEIANIQYSNNKNGTSLYDYYIKGNNFLTEVCELDVLSMLYEATNESLKKCFELYSAFKFTIISIDEYDEILREKIISVTQSSEKSALIPLLNDTFHTPLLMSDEAITANVADCVYNTVCPIKAGQTFFPKYYVFHDCVLILH